MSLTAFVASLQKLSVYTVMQIVAVAALATSCAFLYVELQR